LVLETARQLIGRLRKAAQVFHVLQGGLKDQRIRFSFRSKKGLITPRAAENLPGDFDGRQGTKPSERACLPRSSDLPAGLCVMDADAERAEGVDKSSSTTIGW
jgi:hypothetical protein